MFSLTKLLTLALILLLVWYGFRWIGRLDRIRKEQARESDRLRREAPPRRTASPPVAEDMEKCVRCGVYVSGRSAKPCGRPDCPYAR